MIFVHRFCLLVPVIALLALSACAAVDVPRDAPHIALSNGIEVFDARIVTLGETKRKLVAQPQSLSAGLKQKVGRLDLFTTAASSGRSKLCPPDTHYQSGMVQHFVKPRWAEDFPSAHTFILTYYCTID